MRKGPEAGQPGRSMEQEGKEEENTQHAPRGRLGGSVG